MTCSNISARRMVWIGLGLLSMAFVSARALAHEFELGELGTKVTVDSHWVRRPLKADFGKDQFVLDRNKAFAIVMEVQTLLETRLDFENAFSSVQALVEPQDEAPLKVTTKGEYTYGTRSFNAIVGGIAFHYNIQSVSRAGLTYIVIMWSDRSVSERTDEEADAFLAGLRFPGEQSDWRKTTIPKTFRFTAGTQEVSFQARPSVFKATPDRELLFSLQSHDLDHVVYGSTTEGYSSPEALLSAIHRIVNGDYQESPLKEVIRKDLEVGKLTARMSVCTNGDTTFHLIALPIGGNRMIELRYGTNDSPDATRFDRDLFLKSLSVRDIDIGIEFPDLALPLAPAPLNQYEQQLYERARPVGATSQKYVANWSRLADGTVLAAGTNDIVAIANSNAETIYRDEDWHTNPQIVRHQNQWIAATYDGSIVKIADGVASITTMRGRLLCSAADRLFAIDSPTPISMLGLTETEPIGPDALVVYSPEGDRQELARFDDVHVEEFAVSANATKILLQGSETSGPAMKTGNIGRRLFIYDLAGSARTNLGNWATIDHISSIGDDWLVTGRPEGQSTGIYRVQPTGERQLLLSGSSFEGIDVAEDQLYFASTHHADSNTASGYTVYQIPLTELAPVGPLCHPFDQIALSKIAAETFSSPEVESQLQVPKTREEIDRLWDKADAASRRIVGRSLPRQGFELNALCQELDVVPKFDPPARLLISLVLTVSLLDQGAVWVESPAATSTDWLVPSVHPNDSSFAVGYNVSALFSDLFYDSDGTWNPGTNILASAQGRKLFLGIRSTDLSAAMALTEIADANRIVANGSTEEIMPLLEAARDSLFFREQVYHHLAAKNRVDVLRKVVESFATREAAPLIDRKMWFILRNDLVENPEDAAKLVEELTAAIRDNPREPALYLVLGSAYEKAKSGSTDLRRHCYNRVLELDSWSSISDAAREKLALIDAAEE